MNEHLLDTELVALADGELAAADEAGVLRAHLGQCDLCAERLRTLPVGGAKFETGPAFDVQVLRDELRQVFVGQPSKTEVPERGQVWRLSHPEEAIMALVLRNRDSGIVVAPVTLDAELADDATLVVSSGASPVGLALAVWGGLTSEVTSESAEKKLFDLPLVDAVERVRSGTEPAQPGLKRGVPVVSVMDTRVEYRQRLLDLLASRSPVPYEDEADDEDDDYLEAVDDREAGPERPPRWTEERRELGRLVQELELELRLRRRSDYTFEYASSLNPMTVADVTLLEVGEVVEMDVVLPIFVAGCSSFADVPRHTPTLLFKRYADATAVVIAVGEGLDAEAIAVQPHEANEAIEVPSGDISPPRWPSPLSLPDCVVGFLQQTIWTWEPVSGSALHAVSLDVSAVITDAVHNSLLATSSKASTFKIREKKDGYASVGDNDASAITALLQAAERNGHGQAPHHVDEYIGVLS